MAQVDLHGNIIIDGRTTAGFDSISGKIRSWAQQIGMVGDKIWDFEKESLGIYRDYETNMLQARAALSSTYDSSVELDKVMESLGEHVQEWAVNSIFHVSDFSGAVNNAAHAGWTLEQQLEGIPRAMLLAQAGGLDLSSGLEYLARALNVTGTDFEDSGTLVDQWVKASHLANLTIEDLGDSLNRMGVTAQLTDNTAELFTMLDALAQTGSVGSEAGTLLRGTIMRLIAPTKKAKEAMEELEVTTDEYNELAADSEALSDANKLLEAQGFSAFDANGQLKPLMQTYGELYDALVKIAGSEEDLLTNDEVARILSAIFPQRQISGALSFLQAVKGGWEDLYEAILNSEGTATADAETMMSGLMGAEELFLSKWEEFKRSVGEELSGPFESILGFLGGVVDGLNKMPEEALDALLGGLTGIAALGSSLGIGSGVYKFISLLGVKGMAITLAAFGIGAFAAYLSKVSEIEFKSNFGQMALDIDALNESMTAFVAPSAEGFNAVEQWTKDVNAASEAYGGLAEAFAQELTLDTLTNKTLTESDIGKLKDLGAQMQKEVMRGISEASGRDKTFINKLMGIGSTAEYDDLTDEEKKYYDNLFAATDAYYGELEKRAEEIGKNINDLLTAGLLGGDLTAQDRQAIMDQIQRYNEIMAQIEAGQRAEAREALFFQSQRLSWDSVDDYLKQIEESYETEYESLNNQWASEYGHFKHMHDEGYLDDDTWAYHEKRINEGLQRDLDELLGYYSGRAAEAMDVLLSDSEWRDAWSFLRSDQAENIEFGENGRVSFDNLDFANMTTAELQQLYDQVSDMSNYTGKLAQHLSDYADDEEVGKQLALFDSLESLNQYLGSELSWRESQGRELGGVDEYGRRNLEHIGELDENNTLRVITDLAQALNGQGGYSGTKQQDEWAGQYEQALRRAAELGIDVGNAGVSTFNDRQAYLEAQANNALPADMQAQRELVAQSMALVNKNQALMDANRADYEKADNGWDKFWGMTDSKRKGLDNEYYGYTDPYGDYHMGFVDYQQNAQAQLMQAISSFGASLGELHAASGPLQAPNAAQYAGQQLAEQGVSVQVDGDTTELVASIEAEEGQTLMQYVSGDATDLHMSIYDEDGQTLVENVTGNPAQLESVISGFNGRTVTVFLKGQRLFAEGGRATEPSIFGEGDTAEWAIPEEHTERTAALLNAAREASGFTWGDILGRFGGLNADPKHVNVNVSYAPTINAANADGVQSVLDSDKPRIAALVREAVQRAMANARLHDDVEVYA